MSALADRHEQARLDVAEEARLEAAMDAAHERQADGWAERLWEAHHQRRLEQRMAEEAPALALLRQEQEAGHA